MKAVKVENFKGPLAIALENVPEPEGHQILVQIFYSGLCGSDHHAWCGNWDPQPKLPLTLGHEGVGRVTSVGDQVSTVKVGDMVGVPWLHDTCRKCESCLTGWENLCLSQRASGYDVDGTTAEYTIADSRYVTQIPEGVDLAHIAPILCAGVTVYKALKETHAKPGQWMLISGLGGLGQLGVQYAQAMGFKVIGIDISDSKLEAAKELGATHVFNGRTQDVAKLVEEAVGGAHATVVTAVAAAAYPQALSCLRSRGTLVIVGLPPGDFPVDIGLMANKGLTIRGSAVGSAVDLKEALDIYVNSKIRNNVRIETIDRANDIMQELDQGTLNGRVVFELRKPVL